MKKFSILFLFFILFLIMCSCITTGTTNDAETIDNLLIENPDFTLKDYLRRLSGVQVMDSGGETRVMLRGATSISGDNSPLFVVDGTQVGTSFDAVDNFVSIKDVESITIIRSSEAMPIYGLRASHGAIVIETR